MPWDKRETGTTEVDGKEVVVTFRTGSGDKAGETLVAGGEVSGREFNRSHDHYGPDSSKSNLAKSILNDYDLNSNLDIQKNVGQWIKHNTKRINLILNYEKGILTLNLLEAFVQNRLRPKYEGYDSQK